MYIVFKHTFNKNVYRKILIFILIIILIIRFDTKNKKKIFLYFFNEAYFP